MKIAHVIPELIKGGAEQVVVALANEGAGVGHDVTIIVARDADPALLRCRLDPGVALRTVSGRSAQRSYAALPGWIWTNRAWLRDFDVVHCHLTLGALFGFLLKLGRGFDRSRGPTIIYTAHAVGMPIPVWKRAIERWLRGHFDGVALVSADPDWRSSHDRQPRPPVAVIPNGIVPLRMSLARATDASAPASIGTLGRLVAERRPADLLLAMAVAARIVGPHLRILIGGAGAERENLEKLALELGVAHQVEFPGLIVDPQSFLSGLGLYLSVNVGPQTGIAGLEAASFGLPVIALQARPDYVADDADWIWSTTDPRHLGEAAARLLLDDDERRALRDRQHDVVLKNHGATAMHARYLVLYQEASAARLAPRPVGGG